MHQINNGSTIQSENKNSDIHGILKNKLNSTSTSDNDLVVQSDIHITIDDVNCNISLDEGEKKVDKVSIRHDLIKQPSKRVSFADKCDDCKLVEIHDITISKEHADLWSTLGNIQEIELLDRKCRDCSLSMTGIERKPELTICFEDPSSSIGFMEEFKEKFVSLARCRVRDRTVIGITLVKLVEDESSVLARYTCDGWKTSSDVEAMSISTYTNVEIGHFAFKLELPKDSFELEFAVCHKVANCEYWDNNNGNNYKVQDLRRVIETEDV